MFFFASDGAATLLISSNSFVKIEFAANEIGASITVQMIHPRASGVEPGDGINC